MKKKYNLYIGRWQTPYLHAGHLWCFQQSWDKGIPILIAIRDVETDEKNPFTALRVKENIESQLVDKIKDEMCSVIIIPDILAVVYGRGVGYEITELNPPKEIAEVSATKIREKLKSEQ